MGTSQHIPWLDAWVSAGLKLEHPNGSTVLTALQKMLRVTGGGHDDFVDLIRSAQVFVCEHDWARAFGPALLGAEFRLPFENVIFELKLSGKRVFALLQEHPDDPQHTHTMLLFAKHQEDWMPIECFLRVHGDWWVRRGPQLLQLDDPRRTLALAVAAQVQAICVALEASAATATWEPRRLSSTSPEQAPGRSAEFGFHIVRLRRRAARSKEAAAPNRSSPRLHWRRGHYAMLRGARTWRRWALVGSPDLGFIDKEYRL